MFTFNIYTDPQAGEVAICNDCYNQGHSGHSIQQITLTESQAQDLDRICFFCQTTISTH